MFFGLKFPSGEAKNPSSKWPGGHKSNAESKHIYCSFISIHYKLNLPRATDAKPQFASKISSLEVSNSPRPHQPWHTTVGTLPPRANKGCRGVLRMVQVDWMAVIQHWLKAQLIEEFAFDILVCVTVLEIANETNFND